MTKFLMTLAAILMFFASQSFAQDETSEELVDSVTFEDNSEDSQDDNGFDESETPSANRYSGLGVGYVGSFMLYNFDALYDRLKASNFSGGALGSDFEIKTPLFAHGIGIVAAGSFWGIDNLRLGFFVTGGSGKNEIEFSGGDSLRGVKYGVDYNLLTIDYGIVLWKRVALLPGVGLGWGGAFIELYQTGKEYSWNNDFGSPGSGANYINRAEAGFFTVQPSLCLEFFIPETFTNIRLSGGYTLSFMQDWTMNNSAALKDVPSDINAGGAYFQLGLFFGLFDF